MPTLRDAVRQFDPFLKIPRPVEPIRLQEVRKELEERFGATGFREPDADRLLSTYRKLLAGSDGRGLDQLANSDLKRAPWVIFRVMEGAATPLAENVEFTKSYLRELVERVSAGAPATAIASLIFCFLLFYPAELRIFQPLRRVLAKHVLPPAQGPRIDKWRVCIKECGLLEEDSPERLAKRLAESEQVPSVVLDSCCLRGMLASGGLVEQAYLLWVLDVRRRLANGNCLAVGIERILAFSAHPEDEAKLRYEKSRVSLANGLLLPFAEGNPGPQAAKLIKGFLLKTLGDPRLTGAGRWNGIDERARQVMFGWLVETTLEDFFRLLEYAAQSDATARRHWQARKAFWTRYLKVGLIRDAWVALGPLAQFDARSRLSSESRAYAELERGYSVQSNHSAIIMKIGDLTITEWSHSGKFRFWSADNQNYPRLYKQRYSRSDLIRGSNEPEISHFSGWEQRVSDLIYNHTGLSA